MHTVTNIQSTTHSKDLSSQKFQLKRFFPATLSKSTSKDFYFNHTIKDSIIRTLSDTTLKNALVVSHIRPDLDSYGSILGMSGILKKFGITPYPLINDDLRLAYSRLPSPVQNVYANKFMNTLPALSKKMMEDNIRVFDLVVITDTAEPQLLGEQVVELLSNAKKVIIIDHHPDMYKERSLKESWLQLLKQKGIHPENVLYWREPRVASCELIGELDSRIAAFMKLGILNPVSASLSHDYRLSLAAGMVGDAGILNHKNVKKIKFNRLSDHKTLNGNGNAKLVSSTRHIFDWLVGNADIPKKKVNFEHIIDFALPKKFNKFLDKVMTGKIIVPSVEVKMPHKNNPIYQLYIKEDDFLHHLIRQVNMLNQDIQLTLGDLMGKIKDKIEHNILPKRNIALTVLVHRVAKKNNHYRMSLRSVGKDMLHSETGFKKKIISDGLALETIKHFLKLELGRGGGHNNSAALSIHENKEFMKDILPELYNVIKNTGLIQKLR